MMDIARLAATVRRVAEEQPMYRLETRTDLFAAADVLAELIGPDPKAAPRAVTEASNASEASVVATKGPGPTYCALCGHEYGHHAACPRAIVECILGITPKPVKMTCNPEENERVPMEESAGVQVLLRMEDSPY